MLKKHENVKQNVAKWLIYMHTKVKVNLNLPRSDWNVWQPEQEKNDSFQQWAMKRKNSKLENSTCLKSRERKTR